MENGKIKIGQMILIGSTGRNSGKTVLAAALIKKWKDLFPISALKITTINQKDGGCSRGGTGCGACAGICNDFELIEETSIRNGKDTSLLLAAGAQQVFWLRSLQSGLREAVSLFLTQIPENTVIICESNSLRKFVEPGLFIMIRNIDDSFVKPTAKEVVGMADLVVKNDFSDSINKAADRLQIIETNTGFLFSL